MAKPKPLMTNSSGTELRTPPLLRRCARLRPMAAALPRSRCPAIRSRLGVCGRRRCHSQRQGRLIVTGLGKSGHVARKIAATLASTGTPAFFVHAAEAGMATSA